jgi:hypothetical protein
MSIKRTTVIVVGGVALAAWLSAAMNPGRAPSVPATFSPAPIDATGAMLSGEIARLRERLRPDATPRQANRNPFVFRSRSSPSRGLSGSPRGIIGVGGTVVPAATDASAVAALVDRGRLRLSLAGVAEDPGPAGGAPVRTAIIAGNGQVFLAKEGDTVTDRGVENVNYRLGNISADSAELIDLRDNTIHRIVLK